MNLGDIGAALLSWGMEVFNMFEVTFGDVTINGWSLLLGGAALFIVVNLVARAFD